MYIYIIFVCGIPSLPPETLERTRTRTRLSARKGALSLVLYIMCFAF